jgi:hypothetical protein
VVFSVNFKLSIGVCSDSNGNLFEIANRRFEMNGENFHPCSRERWN